jgi:prevent-host-death family protein
MKSISACFGDNCKVFLWPATRAFGKPSRWDRMTIVTIMTIWRLIVESPVWTVAQAKAKLSEVIEHAQKHGPQAITRNGRRAAVVVSAEEWERKTQRSGSLADFFAASPLRGSGLSVNRSKDKLRKAGL